MIVSMTEPVQCVLELLRVGAEFTLYRGEQNNNRLPVLAVALAPQEPALDTCQRLGHDDSLAAEPDPTWGAKLLALIRHNAVDRLLGKAFLQEAVPLRSHLLLVSGRASSSFHSATSSESPESFPSRL